MQLAVVTPSEVRWCLKRNCSATPNQVLMLYACLCGVSLGLAGLFWRMGATLVLPFAVAEVLALGFALWVYARHATDVERIFLSGQRLRVEQVVAGRCTSVEFVPTWVQVSADARSAQLVVLSGQGLTVKIGGHLRHGLRATLLGELRWALRELVVR
jgi:uncharacterized membrane protein